MTLKPAPGQADHEEASPGRQRWFWLSDFTFRGGRIYIHDTGLEIPLDRQVVWDALVWLGFHLVMRARSWSRRLTRSGRKTVWFGPTQPRPWYLVWSALAWLGYRITADCEGADLRFYFIDATQGAPPSCPAINGRCLDISKSRVARVFEETFGYPLAIDPLAWEGEAVMKSEVNGAHDGTLVVCPAAPAAGKHYQRLIDTSDGQYRYDLRTLCIGGGPVGVWIKQKRADQSFSIQNLRVTLHRPESIFSEDEIRQIGRFLAVMGADWAGLDILRDRASGRIYVVDVNKTDVGPPVALSIRDKIRSTRLLAEGLRSLVNAEAAGRCIDPLPKMSQPISSSGGATQ